MDQAKLYDKYEFLILSELGTVVFRSRGKIDLMKLIRRMELLKVENDFQEDFNFFIDLRNVEYQKNSESVKLFAEYIQSNFASSLKRRIAFITSTLDQIAMASMFKMYQENNLKNIRVFCDIEDAIIWVNESIDEGEKVNLIAKYLN